jgi:GNAT superfamily N-acetyltransferase
VKIRPIADGDIDAIAHMLKALACEFIVHASPPEVAATFLRANDADGIRALIARGHVYHVAELGGEIAGFISVRERSHLFHMFVAKRWHGQGLARALWERARGDAIDAGGDGRFTVNSSNCAVAVYQALGFARSVPMQCKNGMEYNPMLLDPAVRVDA